MRNFPVRRIGCYIDARQEMIGKTFGRLTLLSVHSVIKGYTKYNCRCECGTEKIIDGNSIITGRTKSCGCYKLEVSIKPTTQGLSKHPLYDTWESVIDRCHNSSAVNYQYYGGRGISVCEEWRQSLPNFINWAEMNGYAPGLTLDRYPDQNGNYEPGNCRWATMEDQGRNRRNNLVPNIEIARAIRNDSGSYSEISEKYNVNRGIIYDIKNNRSWKE